MTGTASAPVRLGFVTVVDDLLRDGIAIQFRGCGQSMKPTIRDGELMTVAPIRAAEVRVGHVLLCIDGRGQPVAHRVSELRRHADGATQFCLRGDSSQACDAPLNDSHVRGRVVGVQREGVDVELALGVGWPGRLLTFVDRLVSVIDRGLETAAEQLRSAIGSAAGHQQDFR